MFGEGLRESVGLGVERAEVETRESRKWYSQHGGNWEKLPIFSIVNQKWELRAANYFFTLKGYMSDWGTILVGQK